MKVHFRYYAVRWERERENSRPPIVHYRNYEAARFLEIITKPPFSIQLAVCTRVGGVPLVQHVYAREFPQRWKRIAANPISEYERSPYVNYVCDSRVRDVPSDTERLISLRNRIDSVPNNDSSCIVLQERVYTRAARENVDVARDEKVELRLSLSRLLRQ